MIRRSWFRLGVAHAILAATSAVVALLALDDQVRWAMVGNAVGCAGLAAWALQRGWRGQ
jgi:hypothetical protein